MILGGLDDIKIQSVLLFCNFGPLSTSVVVINVNFVPLFLADPESHDYMKREHSLTKPYQSAGMNVPNWDFLGSTMVTNNYIRLVSTYSCN